jgi:transcriptional regulator with XRE-family HTH domain
MESLKEFLDDEMKKRGWKQADLARAANLDSAVISNIYNGRRKMGDETGRAIANALRIPPEEIFRKAGLLPKQLDDDSATRLAYRIAQLPAEDQEVIDAMIDGLYLKRGMKQNENNRTAGQAHPRPESP